MKFYEMLKKIRDSKFLEKQYVQPNITNYLIEHDRETYDSILKSLGPEYTGMLFGGIFSALFAVSIFGIPEDLSELAIFKNKNNYSIKKMDSF